jgi:hypothetical protein
LIVFVVRRMYIFHESLPLSRPPPVSFLAAEGAADLCAARACVDVGNPAIAALRSKKFFRLAYVVCENGGG